MNTLQLPGPNPAVVLYYVLFWPFLLIQQAIQTSQQTSSLSSGLGYGYRYEEPVVQAPITPQAPVVSSPMKDIIGHLDLITKYNEDESYFQFNDKDYMNIVCDCIDRLLINDKIFEVNTGAIARGYRKTPYPSKNILEYLYAKNARICLNSDCHDKNYLDCAFESSLDLIQSCGFKELQILTNDGFVPVKIK